MLAIQWRAAFLIRHLWRSRHGLGGRNDDGTRDGDDEVAPVTATVMTTTIEVVTVVVMVVVM